MKPSRLALLLLLLGGCNASGTLEIFDDDDSVGDDDDSVGDDDDTVGDDDDSVGGCEGGSFFARPNGSDTFDLWRYEDGEFSLEELTTPGQGRIYATVVTDVNGDGGMDLVVEKAPDWPSQVDTQVFLNDCVGGFERVEVTGLDLSGLSGDFYTAADMDGDGDSDIVGWTWGSGRGLVWLNANGEGTRWELVGGGDGPPPFRLDTWDTDDHNPVEAVSFPWYDFTDDGLPDFVECTNARSAPTACQTQAGTQGGGAEPIFEYQAQQQLNGIAVADFNGDGAPELMGGLDDDGDAGQVWIWPSSGGEPTPPQGPGQEAFDITQGGNNQQDAPGYGWMAAHDWDADGNMDVLVSSLDPFGGIAVSLWVAWGRGDGTFEPEYIGEGFHNYDEEDFWVQDFLGVPSGHGAL